MSEMTRNSTSEDTLIRDSQLSGFSLFKERIGSCCCRLFKKSSNYDLSSVSKDIRDQEDKPSYVNQAFQQEKQARKEKLDKIAKTLPVGTTNVKAITQTPTRSGVTLAQTRTPTAANTPMSKTGISTISKPSPLPPSIKNNNKGDEITTDDSSEDEISSSDDNSSDSDHVPAKRTPVKSQNKRR